MKRRGLILCTVCVSSVTPVFGQTNKQDEPATNRLLELLRHPTFIRLRVSTPNFPSREKPTDAPAPYQEKSLIDFQLFITQNSTDTLTIVDELDPYYEYRPELMRDGEIVPYTKAAQEGVNAARWSVRLLFGGSGARTSVVDLAHLTDLQVELDISQTDFAKLKSEQRAEIIPEAYPNLRFTGFIEEIAPVHRLHRLFCKICVICG